MFPEAAAAAISAKCPGLHQLAVGELFRTRLSEGRRRLRVFQGSGKVPKQKKIPILSHALSEILTLPEHLNSVLHPVNGA